MTCQATRIVRAKALAALRAGGARPGPSRTQGRARAGCRTRQRARVGGGVLLALLCAAATHAAPGTTWRGTESLPDRAPVTVSVEGVPRTYFRVTPQQPLLVAFTGPARLRVVSRVEMELGAETPVAYHVRVATARKLLEQQDTQAPPSSEAEIPGRPLRVGESRQMIVSIPKGKQSLRISVEGAPAILLRLLTAAPERARDKSVALMPVEAARSVTLKEDELLVPYYSVLPGRSVLFRVVGPTTLDLITRLDFDPTMRGVASYRLAIFDGGKPLREVQYATTKALTAHYPDLQDRVPGKFRRLRLAIAPGLHEIRVALVQPQAGSVEVRARIPQLAVGNTE